MSVPYVQTSNTKWNSTLGTFCTTDNASSDYGDFQDNIERQNSVYCKPTGCKTSLIVPAITACDISTPKQALHFLISPERPFTIALLFSTRFQQCQAD